MLSLPVPPSSVSLPAPPSSVSLPPLPNSESLPPSPDSRLAPALPTIVLPSSLPVPAMPALPVSVRFSTLAPRVWVSEDCTVSVPSFRFSVTTSPASSIT